MIKRILAGLMCAAILLPGGTAARAFDGDAEQDNSVTDAPVENDGAEGENKSETDPAPVTIEITSQPTAKTVTFGAENAVFTVEAVGAEGLSYQWYRAESIDGEGEPIENETGAALVLENPTRADDGAEFYCVVSAYGAASVTSSKAELSVCKKAVTLCLTAVPAGGATYGAEVVLTAKISGAVDGTPAGGTVEFLDDKAALDEASGIAVAENSASYSYVMPVSHGAITARYSGDGNYAEADGELGDYDVQKAAQEALVHPETKTAVYPGAIDVAVTGGSADTDVTYEITDQGAAAAALTDSILTATLAGTFTVKATKPGGDNYNCVSTEYEITIAPKPVNIADTAVNDKVYDGTLSAAFAQTPRFAAGGIEPADADDVELVCGTPAFEDVNAADNVTVTFTPFALSGARARNYEIVPPASTAAKIMKRTLTVTAASRTISYGEDIPLKLTVAGFAEGENAETLEDYKSPEVSCEKTKFAASGIYKGAIAVSGGEPTANYKFDYVPGDLTVEAALPVLDTHYTTAAADGKNGWFSKGDFVITPISGTNTSDYDQISVDGEAWFGSLSFTVERALTEVTFYLRDSAMGAQSLKGSASYKIDRTAPSDLGISYSEPLLGKLLSGVTFGYYNPGVVVTLTARDDISGVEYFEWTYTREPDASETISAGSEPARIEAVQSGTDGVYTASFTLTADEAAQYRGSVSFTAADAAGNVSATLDDGASNILVADTIAPRVKIACTGDLRDKVRPDASRGSVPEGSADSETRFIYAGAITADVEATEANFYPEDVSITASRTLDGVSSPYAPEYAKDGWVQNGDTWSLELTLAGDGDYTVAMEYRDRSQNDMAWSSGEYGEKAGVGKYISNTLTIDTTPPAIEVAWEPASSSPNAETYKTDRTAAIRVEDRNFRPYELLPEVSATDIRGGAATMFDAEALIERLRSWEAWEETSLNVWEASVTFSADARYTLALGYTDPAGNAAERYEAAPFVVDHAAPSDLGISYSEPLLGKLLSGVTFGYYNPGVVVTLMARDDISGVEYFEWTYTREPDASETISAGSEPARIEAVQSGTDGVYTASFTLTADEAAQYRGSVSFTAADAAGNVSAVFDDSDKNTLVADTIPPSVRIAYGGKLQDKVRPDASRGSVPEEDVDSATRFIYAGAITVGVEATEANFYPNGSQNGGEYGEDDILITASRTLDGDTATYPLEYAKGDWARDGDTWTLTFALSGDGDYTVEMTYRDRSRNDMAWSSGEYEGKSGDGGAYGSNLLTIDTTPPAIEVAWTPETSASSYKDVHRTDRTAVIRVKERNFRPYEISVPTLTATDIRGGAATMFDAEALIERLRSWEAWEETSLNIWETSVTFSADARYEFALEYTDPAGNAAERYEAAPFTVDHTPPSGLSVTYSEPLLGKLIELVTFGYYNPSVTVTLTASDNTSGVDFFDWTYTRSPEASPVKNAASESARIPAGGIAYGGGTVTTSFVLTADEAKQYSGSISFTARDRAGNTGASYDDSASNAIIVDTISPTRAVIYPAPRQIIDASDMTTIAEDAAEDPAREDRDLILYYDGPVSLTLRVTEANFYAEDIAVEVNDEAPGLEWIKTGGEATDDHEAEIRLAEDGDYVIAVSYTDRSSNEMVSYESERITIDTADPVISVTYSPDEAARAVDGRGYFGGARTAELTVTERNFRADDIEALIEALDSSGGETAGAFAEGLAESLRRRESWTEDGGAHTAVVTYSADANYTFDIAYRDLARREAADYAPDLFTVDTAPPVNHGVAYSESLLETMLEAVTLGFYSARVTVTVSADDDTSGVYGFVYGGTGADGGAPAELYGGEITYGGIEYRDGGRRAEASFEMPKKEAGGGQFDGFVAFTAYDRPGNSSGATGARRIVVDDIAPAVAVTYSAPVRSAGGVRYYAGDIRAAIEVTEANFFAEDVSVLIEKNGGAPAAVSPVWTDGGAGRHTGEFTLTGDGAYTAAVTYTDRSGNEMADYRSERLVIDTKKPVIRLEGIAHESANNGGIIGFTLTAEDENFDIASFAPRLTAIVAPGGAFKTEELPPGTLRIAASGGAYSYVTENLAEDGIYSLVCEAADMSGNAAEEIAVAASGDAAERTVRFSVNRRGSAFMPDENAARLVEAYYVREVYDDIAIIETNADPLLSYKAALNGKELRENEDYAVSFERAGGDDGWYKYTYAFKKELFAAEGEYTLVASSRDKAENDAYSDIKSAEIAFVTDRTAPVLTVAGLRQDGRYQAERQSVTIVPRDDGGKLGSLTATASSGGAESVLLELRGDELLDAIDGGGGALGFAIPSGIGWDVRIVCGDVAVGRDGETNTYDVTFKNVTVSTNAIVIFYANTPVFLGTAAGAALSVGGGAALAKLLKVRKRKGA